MKNLFEQSKKLLGLMVLQQASNSQFQELTIRTKGDGTCVSEVNGQLFGIVGAIAGVLNGMAQEGEMPVEHLADMVKFAAMAMSDKDVADIDVVKPNKETFMKMFDSLFDKEKGE